MRTWLLAIVTGIILAGCHSKGADNSSIGLPVTDQKALKDMAGAWYATKETHAMLEKKKYVRDSVYIDLSPDSSFKVRLPDCMDAASKGGLVWKPSDHGGYIRTVKHGNWGCRLKKAACSNTEPLRILIL